MTGNLSTIKVIAFDADDTLWISEPFFRQAEDRFCEVMKHHIGKKELADKLFRNEIANLPLYGYGAKAFTLSLLQTALENAPGRLTTGEMEQILEIGKSLLSIPLEILPGVEEVLRKLSSRREFFTVVATKGDLLDQEKKLERSGLLDFFQQVFIMSDKNPHEYRKLLRQLGCRPKEFLMVGNSMKSDILPVLELGGHAVYIPFHTTWIHEMVDEEVEHPCLYRCASCGELIGLLGL